VPCPFLEFTLGFLDEIMRIEVRRGRKVMSSKRPKKMQIFKNLIKMTLDMMHEF